MKKKLATIAALAGLAGAAIYLINKILFRLATRSGLLDNEEGAFYSWRFGNIYYKKVGKGSPILLIHDLFPSMSGHEWRKTIDSLSKDSTVYVIDLLGCGQSDKPELTYTNFLYVQMITDFIKDVIGEKCDIITSGSAASIALMACCHDGDFLNRIIISSPECLSSLEKHQGSAQKSLKMLFQLPLIGTLLYNYLFNKANILRAMAQDTYSSPEEVDEGFLSAAHEAAHLGEGRGKYLFGSIKGRFLNANVTHALQSINHSIYIITGTEEQQAYAETYCNLCPSIEIAKTASVSRKPHITTTCEFLTFVNIFLER